MRRALVILAKLVVVSLLIGYVVHTLRATGFDLEKLRPILSGWWWVAIAQVLVFGLLLMTIVRWKLLLEAQGIHYSFREALALGFIGFFFNQFIPGSTGGDIFKAYYVAVDFPEKRAAGITTVFFDRVVGLLDLVVLAGIALLFNWRGISGDPVLRSLGISVAVILGGCLVGGIAFFSEKVRTNPLVLSILGKLPFQRVLHKIQAAIYIYKFHPKTILAAIILSAIVQLSVVCVAICYAKALGAEVNLGSFFFIVPLASLAMAIPLGSPGGLGQSELVYSELFRRVQFQDGLIIALIQRLNWYLLSLVGIAFYLKRRQRIGMARRLAREDAAAASSQVSVEAARGDFPEPVRSPR